MADVIMVVGGSCSGKSVYAEQITAELSEKNKQPVVYLATGIVCDEEFQMRVNKHRERRPSSWETVEEGFSPDRVLQQRKDKAETVLVDGIGTWVTNMMYNNNFNNFSWDSDRQKNFEKRIDLFTASFLEKKGNIILVADEVGMDVVPSYREGRIFRDLNGMANQKLAGSADSLYMVVCGVPVKIK